MWPFRKRPNVCHVVPTMAVAKADFDRIVAERDAANTQLERVSEELAKQASELRGMCQEYDQAVKQTKGLYARIRELEAAIGPDAKALMDIKSIITKRENERIHTAPVETKQNEPLPANDRNMSVFDTTNWEVTSEHRRDETTLHPHSPTGDDSPPAVTAALPCAETVPSPLCGESLHNLPGFPLASADGNNGSAFNSKQGAEP